MIEEKILWLQVPVGYSLLMNIVQALNQLFEVESSNGFAESSSGCNIVEKLTSCGEFQNNIDHSFFFSVLLLNYSIFVVFN